MFLVEHPPHIMLTQEFIAGFISASGTFLKTKKNYNLSFALQIKSSIGNKSLLDQIASTLGVNNRVYIYNGKSQKYSLLIIRDRQSLMDKIIPFLDNRLFGDKNEVFNEWKKSIIKNCSTRNYRNIKNTGSPQGYTIVDKNPNN
jgi:LAGLIDADG endonuclease